MRAPLFFVFFSPFFLYLQNPWPARENELGFVQDVLKDIEKLLSGLLIPELH